MLIKILQTVCGPWATKRGISEDVLNVYFEMLKPYVTIVLVAFVLALLLFGISFKLSKKRKMFVRIQSLVAFLLVCTLVFDVVCYGPMFTAVTDYMDGATSEISEESKKDSEGLVEAIGEEGIVLLKNSNILPLDSKTNNLNVFGWASTSPVYSGTNTEVNEDEVVSIIDSLKDAGYSVNESLLKMYEEYYGIRPSITDKEQNFTLPEPTEDYYSEAIMEEARAFSDTAVIVIARPGAQGEDLPMDMNTIIKGTAGNVLEGSNMDGMSDGADDGALDGADDGALDGADDGALDGADDGALDGDLGARDGVVVEAEEEPQLRPKKTEASDKKDSKADKKKKTDKKDKADKKEKTKEEPAVEEPEETLILSDNGVYPNAVYHNNGYYDDFEEGTSYLEISNTEELLIDNVCSQFEHVILIVNSNNAMKLDWVDDYEQIQAVLSVPGAGATGFKSLGKVINGQVSPSGKTVDTFVKDFTMTPSASNVGYHTFVNGDDLAAEIGEKDPTYKGNISYVDYNEGIYVGYKYYETAALEKQIKYEDVVQYPFGYGLTYTTFDEKIENFKEEDHKITFDVTVTNIGEAAGKDTVEIYFTPPYENGGIEKAAVNLIAFDKTSALGGGNYETLSFSIPKEEFAAYDAKGKKAKEGGYVLEKGTYTISLRSDSHTVIAEESFSIEDDEIFENGKKSDAEKAINRFSDRETSKYTTFLSRNKQFKNYKEACEEIPESRTFMSDGVRESIREQTVVGYTPMGEVVADSEDGKEPSEGGVKEAEDEESEEKKGEFTLADFTGSEYEDGNWTELISQMSFSDMATLINLGGWQTAEVASVGKIQTSDSGDSNGLRNPVTEIAGTLFPTATLMAQTWNKELMNKVGEAIGHECADAGNYGWYGPSLNIHRNVFSGNNYDNFSEDAVLTGNIGSALINGVSKYGVYPYLKHFGLETQETNKNFILLTFANEQAIREIYLKPFEIAVKNFKGQSLAMMASNTWINTVPSCADDQLLNQVLRNEWGFKGMVTTDYNDSYGYQITERCIHNGCDLMLGFNSHETNLLQEGSEESFSDMQRASKNILFTVANSGNYRDGDPYGKMSNILKFLLVVNLIVLALIIILEGLYFARRGARKEEGEKKKAKKEKKAKKAKRNKVTVKDDVEEKVDEHKFDTKVNMTASDHSSRKDDDVMWVDLDDEE